MDIDGNFQKLLNQLNRNTIMKKLSRIELNTLESLLKRAILNEQQFKSDVDITLGKIEPKVVTTGVEGTLDQRGARYGDFSDHARIAQDLQDVMRNFTKPAQTLDGQDYTKTPWSHLTPVAKQALTVIADKIARILNGDPNYADNWHDIQGYAKLVEDRLPKAE